MVVAWASDDEQVATVNEGTVTAIGVGECAITASFEYEGETYSATAGVKVTQPPAEPVLDITGAETWDDESAWNNKQYLDGTGRQTFITWDDGVVTCQFDPEGEEASNLFANLTPNAGDIEFESGYDYYLEFDYDNPGSNEYRVTIPNNTNVRFGGTEDFFTATETREVREIPLVSANASATRLLTLQVKRVNLQPGDPLSFRARLVRRPAQ